MNRIGLIIRGNLLCKGDIAAYSAESDVTALQSPADIVIPKVFRLQGRVYDTTNAIVATGDVRADGNLVAAPYGGGVLITGEAYWLAPDWLAPEECTEYAQLEVIES